MLSSNGIFSCENTVNANGGREDWLRTRECYNCRLKGHLARDCPERRSASSTSGDLEIGGRKGVQTMIDSGADFSM